MINSPQTATCTGAEVSLLYFTYTIRLLTCIRPEPFILSNTSIQTATCTGTETWTVLGPRAPSGTTEVYPNTKSFAHLLARPPHPVTDQPAKHHMKGYWNKFSISTTCNKSSLQWPTYSAIDGCELLCIAAGWLLASSRSQSELLQCSSFVKMVNIILKYIFHIYSSKNI